MAKVATPNSHHLQRSSARSEPTDEIHACGHWRPALSRSTSTNRSIFLQSSGRSTGQNLDYDHNIYVEDLVLHHWHRQSSNSIPLPTFPTASFAYKHFLKHHPSSACNLPNLWHFRSHTPMCYVISTPTPGNCTGSTTCCDENNRLNEKATRKIHART